LEEINRQAILIEEKLKVEENLTGEIHRQLTVIAERSQMEANLRAELIKVSKREDT